MKARVTFLAMSLLYAVLPALAQRGGIPIGRAGGFRGCFP